jgi:Cu+-exporting ATPase
VTHVKAELLPDEVGPEVARLRGAGGLVAAIGHRETDGAALAAADVPITLASAGAPTGERAVALCTADLRDAAAALWMARAARTEALRAWAVAISVGGITVAAACVGWLGPGIASILAASADAFVVPAGARLLRRIDLREPFRG